MDRRLDKETLENTVQIGDEIVSEMQTNAITYTNLA